MPKVIVVTDPYRADGFRLAGVDVLEAADAEEAQSLIQSLLDSEDAGVVAVNTQFLDDLSDRMRSRIDQLMRPVFVPLPSTMGTEVGARRQYISDLIRSAIGIQIAVPGE
jgi:vacuolar-type H+-ATPase subunit F/Vma7